MRFPRDLWSEWERYAARYDQTAMDALRVLMQWLVRREQPMHESLDAFVTYLQKRDQDKTAPKLPPRKLPGGDVDRGKKHRVEVGFTPSEMAALTEAAALSGGCSVQFWIVTILRAVLTRGYAPAAAEVEALAEANYQLMAIGRNLNQIAHHINANPAKNLHALTAEAIARLEAQIADVRQRANAVIAATSERWEVS